MERDQFNLWRGFAVEPREGDCSKFVAHLRNDIANGNEEHFRWVEAWLAQLIQKPDEKIGTGLVLRGPQGIGKTFVGETIGRLLGEHYRTVSKSEQVTGRFNGHQSACLLLQCEEAFWAGSKEAEGVIKDLVTCNNLLVEFKCKEPILIPNFTRLLITSNNDWIVPAGFGERRWAVLDCAATHKDNHAYFSTLHAELNHGGLEALLHHLLHVDISSVNLRKIFRTEALLDQQIRSLPTDRQWLYEILLRGCLPGATQDVPNRCSSRPLFDDYLEYAKDAGLVRKSAEIIIGKMLKILKVQKIRRHRVWSYKFPPLAECRILWDAEMGTPTVWEEPEYWEGPPAPMDRRSADF